MEFACWLELLCDELMFDAVSLVVLVAVVVVELPPGVLGVGVVAAVEGAGLADETSESLSSAKAIAAGGAASTSSESATGSPFDGDGGVASVLGSASVC